MTRPDVVSEFHKEYYYSSVWNDRTTWFGVDVQKCPLDLWIYQEIIHEVKPGLIVECGTWHGGSAFFLANMCEFVGRGEVVSVDIKADASRPVHRRITYIQGSSTDPAVIEKVRKIRGLRGGPECTTLVILDSDHSKDHVLREMEMYAPLVSGGSYLIVEDGNLGGHPVIPGFGAGPAEAIAEFLPKNPDFSVDPSREKFLMTFNPGGYLKKAVAVR